MRQRGSGAYLLCGTCNNWAGRELVPEYIEWAQPVLSQFTSLSGAALLSAIDTTQAGSWLSARWLNRRPGAFARQDLAMCLTACDGALSADLLAVCRRAIRTPGSSDVTALPRLSLQLYAGPSVRMGKPQGSAHIVDGRFVTTVATEVAAPPFAFTLTLSGEPPAGSVDITHWVGQPLEHVAPKIQLLTNLGFGHAPWFGDFRTTAAISTESGEGDPPAFGERLCVIGGGDFTVVQVQERPNPSEVTFILPGVVEFEQAAPRPPEPDDFAGRTWM